MRDVLLWWWWWCVCVCVCVYVQGVNVNQGEPVKLTELSYNITDAPVQTFALDVRVFVRVC